VRCCARVGVSAGRAPTDLLGACFQESVPILSVKDYMITGGLVTVMAQIETVTVGYLLLQMFS